MKWRIHLRHPGGETWVAFTGTRAEAEARGAQYLGKPASWNCTKQPNEPNLWDCYATFDLFELKEIAPPESETQHPDTVGSSPQEGAPE